MSRLPQTYGGRSLRALQVIVLTALALTTLPAAEPANPANSAAVSYTFKPAFDAAAAGLAPLFNGRDFTGWRANPECWKIVQGTLVGTKDNQLMTTVADYDSFRLIVCSSQADPPMNHQGIAFWGDRTPDGNYGYGDCLLFTPPNPGTWDYKLKGRAPGKVLFSRDLEKEGYTRSQWTQAELLVNRATGTVRMAVDGKEVISYVDNALERRKKGPIGLQAHGGSHDVRYRDVYIEVDPKSDKLLTVK